MKRFLIVILIIGLFIANIPVTKAEEITFAKIGEAIKTYKMPSELSVGDFGQEVLLERSTIDVTENKITIKYNYDANRDDGIDENANIKTEFNYEGDEITFNYTDAKNDKYTMSRTLIDSVWIMDLIFVVGNLNGYSEEDLINWFQIIDEEEDLKDYGVEFKTFSYSFEEQDGQSDATVTGTGTETFKINIKKFNLGYTTIKYGLVKNGNKVDLKITGLTPKEGATYSYNLSASKESEDTAKNYENYKELKVENNGFVVDVTDIYELSGDLKLSIAEKMEESYTDIVNSVTIKRLDQNDLSKRITVNLLKDKTEFKVNEIYSEGRTLKLNYKIGQVSDTKILNLIKNDDKEGLSNLLTYAKEANGVEGSLASNETILNKLKIKNKAYYYVYYEIEDEDGKYYPIEDINLYMGDAEGNLISYTSNKFKWDETENVPDNPKTGIENYLIFDGIGILGALGIAYFVKKKSLFREI